MNDNPQPDLSDPRLDYEIRYLEVTTRGRKACQQLRVKTVRDFLERNRRDFITLKNCGERTYEDLANRVYQSLAVRQPANNPTDGDLSKPLMGLIHNPRAERAFLVLGITTVGEFLDTPKQRFLAIAGFGERTYWEVAQRVRAVVGHEAKETDLLPGALLDFPISGLGLASRVEGALADLGVDSIRELLNLQDEVLLEDATIGEVGIATLRTALDRLVRVGVSSTLRVDDTDNLDFFGLVSKILSILDHDQTILFRRRVGLDCPPATLRDVARRLRLGEEEVRILEENTRLSLREHAPSLLTRLREEAHRELRAFEGMIHCDTLAPGTLLHNAGKCTGDRTLPLRLLWFFFAREFFLYDDFVSTLPPGTFRKLRRTLHRATTYKKLPVTVADVEAQADQVCHPVPLGLMMHLLKTKEQLVVRIHPKAGEVLHRGVQSIADRLADLLADEDRPEHVEDILFCYRDRYRRGSMGQLLDNLRQDSRFFEVSRETWSLRSRHLEELALSRPEADTIVEIIEAQRGRQNVFTLHRDAGLPERKTYMVIECLRQDSRIRHLGRGLFCGAGKRSTVMLELEESMSRAMGEIVISRFLANQHPRVRRLTEVLLRHNRAFIQLSPDRIDVLSNYPFNDERLEQLFQTIANELASGRGFADASHLLAVINRTELGGSWFTEHMLRDLLRRRSSFELLPGGIIAQANLGLGGWIQQRARECLRQADTCLSPQEVLAEIPELAAFAESLEDLLDHDPMVQCVDGEHYSIV